MPEFITCTSTDRQRQSVVFERLERLCVCAGSNPYVIHVYLKITETSLQVFLIELKIFKLKKRMKVFKKI